MNINSNLFSRYVDSFFWCEFDGGVLLIRKTLVRNFVDK